MKSNRLSHEPSRLLLSEEWRRWHSAAEQCLEPFRQAIREQPIKFVALSAWSAFFLALVLKG